MYLADFEIVSKQELLISSSKDYSEDSNVYATKFHRISRNIKHEAKQCAYILFSVD